MSSPALFLRAAAPRVGAGLALNLAACAGPSPGGELANKPGESSTWVKLCEKSRVSSKDKQGQEIAKNAEMCTTLTEQIHPGTGAVMLSVALQQVQLDGKEKQTLTLAVPKGVAMELGAAITVFPADLWLKVQRNERPDAADEGRLKAGSVKLAFKQCAEAGCVAETEATAPIIDLLKDNAGLMVQTVRLPRMPVAQLVLLNGFAQALTGPPTDTRKFKEAREQSMKMIAERQKGRG